MITKTKFDGQLSRVSAPPLMPPKPLFGEKLQLKPMYDISAYFLKTDEAIITKLDQNIKQIELYTDCKIRGQRGVA